MKALALHIAASFTGTLLGLWLAYGVFLSPIPIPTFGWVWPQ